MSKEPGGFRGPMRRQRGALKSELEPGALYDARAKALVAAYQAYGAGGIDIDALNYRSYFRGRFLSSPDPTARELAAALDRRFGLP